MPEEGFDTDRQSGGAKQNFLRLKDGEKALVRLLHAPTKYRQHWVNGRSEYCTLKETGACAICNDSSKEKKDRYATLRFGVPVYLHKISLRKDDKGKPVWDGIEEVKTFENSGATLDALAAVVEEYPWTDTDLIITRKGAGTDTTYTIMPSPKNGTVPDGLEIPNLMEFYQTEINKAAGAASPSQSLSDMAKPPEPTYATAAVAAGAVDDDDPGDPF